LNTLERKREEWGALEAGETFVIGFVGGGGEEAKMDFRDKIREENQEKLWIRISNTKRKFSKGSDTPGNQHSKRT